MRPSERCDGPLPLGRPRRAPTAWCVLDVSTAPDGPGVAGQVKVRLAGWAARYWRTYGGRTVCGEIHQGRTAAGARALLARYARYRSRPWVASWGCAQAWPLLDVWAYLDTSEKAVLLLADPPCLATVCPQRQGRRLWWFDLRNWSAAGYPHGANPWERLDWCCEFVRGAVYLTAAHGLGAPAMTAGRTAVDAWLAAPDRGTPRTVTDPRVCGLESEAVFPGRLECGRLGYLAGAHHVIDRRACYPALCLTESLPCALVEYAEGGSVLSLDVGRPDRSTIAEVEVVTDEPAYPCRHKGLVVYPLGRFRSVLAGPELADALYHGRVRRVLRRATYECWPALAGHASRALALREGAGRTGHDGLLAWSKVVGNALVGALAQTRRRWVPCEHPCPPTPWGQWTRLPDEGEPVHYRAAAGKVWRLERQGYCPWALPAVTAHVCSAGRALALGAYRQAGWAEVPYWDTDGGIVTDNGLSALSRRPDWWGLAWGRLRVVESADCALILGLKAMALGGVVRAAGVPKGTVLPDPGGGEDWYCPALDTQLRLGRAPAAELARLAQRRLEVYRHGVVLPGGRVHPFVLGGPSDATPQETQIPW